jgi:hypothetical protein
MGEGGTGGEIVVPLAPGPLVRPPVERRRRDELDDVIDELFPDTDEPPGWFDAGLVGVGSALIGWALTGGPGWAAVVGGGPLALGVILPLRWAWRRVQLAHWSRQSRRSPGVALPGDDPTVGRLVQAYDELVEVTGTELGDPARIAGHGAMVAVATLLDGRSAGSDVERDYVVARAAAIEDLVAALRRHPLRSEPGRLDPTLVAKARDELDALTDGGSLARLAELTERADLTDVADVTDLAEVIEARRPDDPS